MVMRTESGTTLAAWVVVPLAGAGAVLGLWQVGAFDRPAPAASAAFSSGAGADRTRPRRAQVEFVATPAGPGRSNAVAGDTASPGPVTRLQQPDRTADREELAESTARLEALAAEQVNDP